MLESSTMFPSSGHCPTFCDQVDFPFAFNCFFFFPFLSPPFPSSLSSLFLSLYERVFYWTDQTVLEHVSPSYYTFYALSTFASTTAQMSGCLAEASKMWVPEALQHLRWEGAAVRKPRDSATEEHKPVSLPAWWAYSVPGLCAH